MLSKTLCVLDLAEPITDILYHSGDSIDSVKRPAGLLLASLITACYGASHICCTLHGRRSTRLSSTTLRNVGLSYEFRRRSGIQPIRWIRTVIPGNYTQRVPTPQNYRPPNLPETRRYMGPKMATFTLQSLCRAHETAHRRRRLKPDLSCRTWYQCGSSVRTSQTRLSH